MPTENRWRPKAPKAPTGWRERFWWPLARANRWAAPPSQQAEARFAHRSCGPRVAWHFRSDPDRGVRLAEPFPARIDGYQSAEWERKTECPRTPSEAAMPIRRRKSPEISGYPGATPPPRGARLPGDRIPDDPSTSR